ncbi:AraC family transcriptional regulator [Photobacterium damselae]|uniref:AraC family transcriptional regulator n=1 Tax=Photobacterium damselae TaxID=38293 RepID=UPI002F3F2153
MMTPDRIKLPSAFWLGVDRLNISRSLLVKRAELPLSVGLEQAKVTTAQFFALWSALEQLKGPDVGMELANALDSKVLPPSFLVAYHAKNFLDAVQRVVRYKSLCAPEQLILESGDKYTKIVPHWPFAGNHIPSALTDATFVSIIALGRNGTDNPIQNIKLELRRAKSKAVADYFQCPIKWNAEQDSLYISNRMLNLPFTQFNTELTAMLDRALDDELAQQQASTSMSDKVRWLLRKSLAAGRPELKSVARELAISERTLQRQLSNEGGNFQGILSDTRHELALEYLRETEYDLSEIAYMLGYEDQASFFRAFQAWENITPSKWREEHRLENRI